MTGVYFNLGIQGLIYNNVILFGSAFPTEIESIHQYRKTALQTDKRNMEFATSIDLLLSCDPYFFDIIKFKNVLRICKIFKNYSCTTFIFYYY